MSISSAMASAMSGLTASGRTAEIISNNISNALTDGFGRREISLSSNVLDGYGAGVRVNAMTRAEDPVATSSRRAMETLANYHSQSGNAAARMTSAMGAPGEPGSLPEMFTVFESAIVAASNNPSSQTHLDNAVARATDLTLALQKQSQSNMQIRMDADAEIGRQVDTVNNNLLEIERLNLEIRKRFRSPSDIAGLQDTQQQLIDEIATIVPVKVAKRDLGEVALFTPNGGVLLDGTPRLLDFSTTPMITHAMTIGNGAISGLGQNGTPVPIGGGAGLFDGGSLSALFETRDMTVPSHNSQVDALARDLVERFQSTAVDPTLLPGDAGLFTDGGIAFTAANELGLAGRISVNSLADPTQGGASWRLRDGLNAVAQGDVGQNAILRNLESALTSANAPSANLGISTAQSAAGFASDLTAQRYSDQNSAEQRMAYSSSQLATLELAESSSIGVDTDEQLQRLLETEKAYAANARVISTLDGLLAELLRI